MDACQYCQAGRVTIKCTQCQGTGGSPKGSALGYDIEGLLGTSAGPCSHCGGSGTLLVVCDFCGGTGQSPEMLFEILQEGVTPYSRQTISNMNDQKLPGSVTDHAGSPLPHDRDFFAAPPSEIGPLRSAYSTLRLGRETNSVGAKIGFALGERPICSYVGDQGVAFVPYFPDPRKRAPKILLFQWALELRTSQTHHFGNGVYQNTAYTFIWLDHSGRTVYSLSDTHRSPQGTPPPGDKFHFARAAEDAWTSFVLAHAITAIDDNGAVRFNLKFGDHINLGPGYVELHIGRKAARCSTREIARLRIDQGVVTLRRENANDGFLGIGTNGVFSFDYADIGNARLFFALFDRLVGIRGS